MKFIRLHNILKQIVIGILLMYSNLWLVIASETVSYYPQGNDIVCVNGIHRFTRAIYGTNTPFRFETSDFPEFGLYMPNLGGSMYFALTNGEHSKWINEADYIQASYSAGKRSYIIKDQCFLGNGELRMDFLAWGDADGIIVKMEGNNIPVSARLISIFGGANDEYFRREGDLGADRADCFYIKPERCKESQYVCKNNTVVLSYGKRSKELYGVFPISAELELVDATCINDLNKLLRSKAGEVSVLKAVYPIQGCKYISFVNPETTSIAGAKNLAAHYENAERCRLNIANKVVLKTPDKFLNPTGGNLAMAADAVWQSPMYHHGSIGWRIPLMGWRHCYIGDFLGWKDRSRSHFDYYAKLQMTDMPDKPVIMDADQKLARAAYIKGTPMYSSGYISNCQKNELYFYDMNLVYIDALLWHLNWTGDLEYARKMWSVITKHLAWEKRTFDPDDDGLYDAVCCIWASDALQYSGGAVTHSSAYNFRANKMAAMIAEKIGEKGDLYLREAFKIRKAIDNQLWLKKKGWWAEYKGVIGNQQLHESAAAWTVYHAIDSELSDDNFSAYQAGRYAITGLPHIPVKTNFENETGNTIVSTTNWMPYEWSVNNVAFAETSHTALALFEAGLNEEAYKLMKGTILDVMYQGKSPGNFGMTTSYDIIGEVYRDFSDGVGIYSRLLVQGLFGISPDALNGKIQVTPGFPSMWNDASIETSDIAFAFQREGDKDIYKIHQKADGKLRVVYNIPVRKESLKEVRVNGKKMKGKYVCSVGKPIYQIECDSDELCTLELIWKGKEISKSIFDIKCAFSDTFSVLLDDSQQLISIYDPQEVLVDVHSTAKSFRGKVVGEIGYRTLFAKVKQGEVVWYMPVDLEVIPPFEVVNEDAEANSLKYHFRNNTQTPLTFSYWINGINHNAVSVPIKGCSESFSSLPPTTIMGTNQFDIVFEDGNRLNAQLVNWNIPNDVNAKYICVDMDNYFNGKVTQIFKNEYLSPRSPYSTLQIPTDGFGDWCVPLRNPNIDDSGFRAGVKDGVVTLHSLGIKFKSQSNRDSANIAYTSLWDNYPDSIMIPLRGRASHAYLLMAGSTNHMQSRFVNGVITVQYEDGTSDKLDLVNPDTWVPIEQDFYLDEYAYKVNKPHPYRVLLKDGFVSRNLTMDKKITAKAKRIIDGGAAVLLDLPLSKEKKLKSLTLTTKAYEVVIGLMGITLVDN